MCACVFAFSFNVVGEGQVIQEWVILGASWHQCEQSMASDGTKGFSEAAGEPKRGRDGTGESRR